MSHTQKKSILCPNCRKLINREEPVCPYCGITNPGSRWKNNPWTRGLSNADQVIKGIIGINIGMYVLSILLNPMGSGLGFSPFSFLAPSPDSLFSLGATGTYPIDVYQDWWTLVSANYLHGSLLHILFNMLAFRQLAPLIIQEYGIYRMLAIYTLSGVLGFLVSYLAGIPFTIGASAAVCGLMGAILYYGKSRGGAYGQALFSQVGGWAVGIFLFGFVLQGINNWAHGGGMAAGALLGFMLGYKERKRESLAHKILAGGCAAGTVLVLLWAVITGFLGTLMF